MPRRLPPLNALKAFEAAARHESFTRAAEELCVTQGAVSHQVKALEAELGLKLFNRERQRLVITQAGRAYLEVVRDALDRIAAGTERLLQRQSAGALTVSTSPNFAAKWLVHRLGRFAGRARQRGNWRGGSHALRFSSMAQGSPSVRRGSMAENWSKPIYGSSPHS